MNDRQGDQRGIVACTNQYPSVASVPIETGSNDSGPGGEIHCVEHLYHGSPLPCANMDISVSR